MSAKKAPSIDVPTDALKDESYEVLAEIAGLANKYEALGRITAIKLFCRDRGLKDAPDDSTGYVVSEAVIQRWLGPNGVNAILGAGVDDFALGVRREDGRIMLRGTEDLVAALRQRRDVATAGGKARSERARDQGARDEGGRYTAGTRLDDSNDHHETTVQSTGWTPAGPTVSQTTDDQPEPSRQLAEEPANTPAANQPQPASSSYLLPLTSYRDQEKNSATPSAGGSRRSKSKKSTEPTETELASVRVVLDKLSAQNGVRYSGTQEHTRLIVNQLRSGVGEMDLRAVIGFCADELGWKNKPEMVHCLRPETLFGPKTIARYLDPARSWFEKLRSARAAQQQRRSDERPAQGASA